MSRTKPKSRVITAGRKRTAAGLNNYGQASALTGWRIEDLKIWKRDGCPAFRNNMIFTDEIQPWLDEKGIDPAAMDEDAPDGPLLGTPMEVNRERIKKMRKEQRRLDTEHEVAIGKLVDKEAVKKDLAAIMEQVTGILKKTCDRQQYNAIAKQFAQVDFKKLGEPNEPATKN